MKRTIALVAVLACALVAAAPAEAAKTSEREGRKYTRKWLNHAPGLYSRIDFDVRRCWRIGRGGAGYYGILPLGVVCQASGRHQGTCWIVTVAVKDKGRHVVAQRAQPPFYAEMTYCKREPGAEKPPRPIGSRGDPL